MIDGTMTFRFACIVVLASLTAACTSEGTVETQPTVATTGTTASLPETTSTTSEDPTGPTPPESMPGDVIEFGPRAGDQIAVVGVAHDDTLNVRIAPGTEFEVIEMLDPLVDDIVALGENRLLTSSFWVEVESGDGAGWVNEAFVGFLGVSQESTSPAVATTGGPVAVGELVAQTYVSQDPPSTVTLVSDEEDTVIYDVIGLGDDAVKGFRLIFITEPVSGGTGVASFTEQTICSRGLAQDLLCV